MTLQDPDKDQPSSRTSSDYPGTLAALSRTICTLAYSYVCALCLYMYLVTCLLSSLCVSASTTMRPISTLKAGTVLLLCMGPLQALMQVHLACLVLHEQLLQKTSSCWRIWLLIVKYSCCIWPCCHLRFSFKEARSQCTLFLATAVFILSKVLLCPFYSSTLFSFHILFFHV